jgi:hypothetical protein
MDYLVKHLAVGNNDHLAMRNAPPGINAHGS